MSETEKGPELLPCPFCGGEARFVDRVSMVMIGCDNTNCYAQPIVSRPKRERKRVVQIWNTRATP